MDPGRTGTAVTEEKGLAQFLQGLDEKSRCILGYLWWRRHADISELRNIGDTADDSEVLFRLKEIINRKALEFFGKPLVGFEQARIDPLSGVKFLFNWWYLEDGMSDSPQTGGALVDIFNEKDNVTIVAQLPSAVELSAPDIRINNGLIRITLKKLNTHFERAGGGK
jgi:hypothetical protein